MKYKYLYRDISLLQFLVMYGVGVLNLKPCVLSKTVADPSEHSNEPSDSIKGGEFLDLLSDCQLLKKDSIPYS
jgi:hypothetical protein